MCKRLFCHVHLIFYVIYNKTVQSSKMATTRPPIDLITGLPIESQVQIPSDLNVTSVQTDDLHAIHITTDDVHATTVNATDGEFKNVHATTVNATDGDFKNVQSDNIDAASSISLDKQQILHKDAFKCKFATGFRSAAHPGGTGSSVRVDDHTYVLTNGSFATGNTTDGLQFRGVSVLNADGSAWPIPSAQDPNEYRCKLRVENLKQQGPLEVILGKRYPLGTNNSPIIWCGIYMDLESPTVSTVGLVNRTTKTPILHSIDRDVPHTLEISMKGLQLESFFDDVSIGVIDLTGSAADDASVYWPDMDKQRMSDFKIQLVDVNSAVADFDELNATSIRYGHGHTDLASTINKIESKLSGIETNTHGTFDEIKAGPTGKIVVKSNTDFRETGQVVRILELMIGAGNGTSIISLFDHIDNRLDLLELKMDLIIGAVPISSAADFKAALNKAVTTYNAAHPAHPAPPPPPPPPPSHTATTRSITPMSLDVGRSYYIPPPPTLKRQAAASRKSNNSASKTKKRRKKTSSSKTHKLQKMAI